MSKLSLVPKMADGDRRQLLQDIAGLIARARSSGLTESVFLLSMAYLDLQTKIYDINDEELDAFSKVIRSSVESV